MLFFKNEHRAYLCFHPSYRKWFSLHLPTGVICWTRKGSIFDAYIIFAPFLADDGVHEAMTALSWPAPESLAHFDGRRILDCIQVTVATNQRENDAIGKHS